MKRDLYYLACPYAHPDENIRKKRYLSVTWTACQLLQKKIHVFSPITHNIPITEMGIEGTWENWSSYDLGMLSRCDKLLVLELDGWKESKGVQGEIAFAKEHQIPIERMDPPVDLDRIYEWENRLPMQW